MLDCSFRYRGLPDQDLITAFGSILRIQLEKKGTTNRVKEDAFAVLIEALQNALKHGASADAPGYQLPICHWELDDTPGPTEYDLSIVVRNDINADQARGLELLWLKYLSMDMSERNHYYRELRRSTQISSDGNAGLGLLEIARRATGGLQFQIRKRHAHIYRYSLSVTVTITTDTV